jgi:cysteine desulfuration protein SufE
MLAHSTPIETIQAEILDEFAFLGDWEEKYRHIIQTGKELPAYPEAHRLQEYRVRGCQSQVWLYPTWNETTHTLSFSADSDAAIVKGLIALLLRVYSHQTPATILATEPHFMKDIGLDSHLSQNRTNGFASMVKQIKVYALAYQSKYAGKG